MFFYETRLIANVAALQMASVANVVAAFRATMVFGSRYVGIATLVIHASFSSVVASMSMARPKESTISGMFGFPKRKYSAADVAKQLARLPFQIEDDRTHLAKVSEHSGAPIERVEHEYCCLRAYLIETVVQSISDQQQLGDSLLRDFYSGVQEEARNIGFSENFWQEQEDRTSHYDDAWADPRGIGTPVAMNTAVAMRILNEQDWDEAAGQSWTTMPLWLMGNALMVELLKFIRSIRITSP